MATNQFMLFGHDVRDYGRLWLAAWQDLLFGDDSPIRRYLDGRVTLETDAGEETWQAGRKVDVEAVPQRAIPLPDSLILHRTLSLPSSAIADIASAVALEVSASSPFAVDDTAYGWRASQDEQGTLCVDLVIVSRGAVMSFLSHTRDIHDPSVREIWAPVADSWVVVAGFGEDQREIAYRARLVKSGLMLLAAALLIVAIVAISAVFSGWKLSRLEAAQTETLQEARAAMELRDRLAETNAVVSQLNALVGAFPNPHGELLRLTEHVPDTAYISQFTQNGREIRLRGRGADGAALMQSLIELPAYASVTAPQAIRSMGNTGVEQFYLDIELSEGTP
ncbi:hypothetical protein NOR51B_2386 [Luminiphilus syltensis NOR5-1B]|uniref:General secretion pathway protein L n=1 Tax=Luminiphilus syltensis NOR5-1B TaxID=565045 RepID=B8KWY8_9GAMM|nr:hypothetical protein [Luminiphilus syltensis]EED36435.1 hypothetical protein NOR51B_2386 [Luminiphilus syltensis NOR5-1B]